MSRKFFFFLFLFFLLDVVVFAQNLINNDEPLTGHWKGYIFYQDIDLKRFSSIRLEMKLKQIGNQIEGTSFDCFNDYTNYCIANIVGTLSIDSSVFLYGKSFFNSKTIVGFKHFLCNYEFKLINNTLEGISHIIVDNNVIYQTQYPIKVFLKKQNEKYVDNEKYQYGLKDNDFFSTYNSHSKKIEKVLTKATHKEFFDKKQKNNYKNNKNKNYFKSILTQKELDERTEAKINLKTSGQYKYEIVSKTDTNFINQDYNNILKTHQSPNISLKNHLIDSLSINNASSSSLNNIKKQYFSFFNHEINNHLFNSITAQAILLDNNRIDSLKIKMNEQKNLRQISKQIKNAKQLEQEYSFEFLDSLIYMIVQNVNSHDDTIAIFKKNKLLDYKILTPHIPAIYKFPYDGKNKLQINILDLNQRSGLNQRKIILKNNISNVEYHLILSSKGNEYNALYLRYDEKELNNKTKIKHQ